MKEPREKKLPEEQDELWNLLGQAPRPPEASPFFARNVLRQVREDSSRSTTFSLPRLFRPLAVSAAVLVAAILVFRPEPQQPAVETAVNPDAALVEEFDNLIAYSL